MVCSRLVLDGPHIRHGFFFAIAFCHGQVTLDLQDLVQVPAQEVDQWVPPEEALEDPDHPRDQEIMRLKML